MPRHPPIALKTLDRSHCQCPPARSREIVTTAKSCAGFSLDGISQKRPASRDLSGGAVRQTHHVREIERLTATDRHHHHPADQRGLWPQRPDSDDGTRTNL